MLEHALDAGVYIRSMASRGDEGVFREEQRTLLEYWTQRVATSCSWRLWGFGQAEIEIVKVADLVIVVLMPELGDEIQAIKAGLMEIGDIFIVNKSDLPGV